jgi:hypothetical protein
MTDDIRALELNEGQRFREYGMDDIHTVRSIDFRGDTALIDCEAGCEITLDGDTVVEDYTFHPVSIKGTVTLANGAEYQFSIGDVAGSIGWQQWGHIPDVLSQGVALMDGLVEKINEDNLLLVPHG